ncbi:MAG: hypothetical protein U1E53_02015 [Dongiaceae bacterium]
MPLPARQSSSPWRRRVSPGGRRRISPGCSPLFLPCLRRCSAVLLHGARDGYVDATLAQHTLASLGRIFLALAAACSTAISPGQAIGISPVARGLVDPVIEFYWPIPPLAYLPLIVIWFGIGEPPRSC